MRQGKRCDSTLFTEGLPCKHSYGLPDLWGTNESVCDATSSMLTSAGCAQLNVRPRLKLRKQLHYHGRTSCSEPEPPASSDGDYGESPPSHSRICLLGFQILV